MLDLESAKESQRCTSDLQAKLEQAVQGDEIVDEAGDKGQAQACKQEEKFEIALEPGFEEWGEPSQAQNGNKDDVKGNAACSGTDIGMNFPPPRSV